MKVEYSKRAIADLRQIAAYYTRSSDPAVARIAIRIEELVARIAALPLSEPPVIERTGVRELRLLAANIEGKASRRARRRWLRARGKAGERRGG